MRLAITTSNKKPLGGGISLLHFFLEIALACLFLKQTYGFWNSSNGFGCPFSVSEEPVGLWVILQGLCFPLVSLLL